MGGYVLLLERGAALTRDGGVLADQVSVISIIEGAVFKESEGPRSKRMFFPPASVPA